jgi:hypothetical protein
MTRLLHAWSAMSRERRLAALAALALLVTMFLPWYGLQSLNRKTGVIYSHDISAFGDVSFVEAAIFLVAVAVMALLLARAEGREFHMPGGDGTIVTIAGAWAGLLIFYRVFSRPPGHDYPVGIEWGFFLAFVAAGSLAFAGWRMRTAERPEPPVFRGASRRPRPTAEEEWTPDPAKHETAPVRMEQPPAAPATEETVLVPGRSDAERAARSPRPAKERPRFPPAPPEQLSFEDPPRHGE